MVHEGLGLFKGFYGGMGIASAFHLGIQDV